MIERVPKNRIAYRSAGNAKNLNLNLSSVTDVLTTFVEVIFRVKVSRIMSVDGIKLWLLTSLASLLLLYFWIFPSV